MRHSLHFFFSLMLSMNVIYSAINYMFCHSVRDQSCEQRLVFLFKTSLDCLRGQKHTDDISLACAVSTEHMRHRSVNFWRKEKTPKHGFDAFSDDLHSFLIYSFTQKGTQPQSCCFSFVFKRKWTLLIALLFLACKITTALARNADGERCGGRDIHCENSQYKGLIGFLVCETPLADGGGGCDNKDNDCVSRMRENRECIAEFIGGHQGCHTADEDCDSDTLCPFAALFSVIVRRICPFF
jgi:hypothetical protein